MAGLRAAAVPVKDQHGRVVLQLALRGRHHRCGQGLHGLPGVQRDELWQELVDVRVLHVALEHHVSRPHRQ